MEDDGSLETHWDSTAVLMFAVYWVGYESSDEGCYADLDKHPWKTVPPSQPIETATVMADVS
jgi:hypothetical protein